MSLEEAMAEIVERHRLHDLVVTLHRGFDRLDDDLIVASIVPGCRYGAREWADPEDFAHHVRRMHTEAFGASGLALRYTQHAITNERYELAGDTAHGECYATFRGVTVDNELVSMILRYVDRYVRVDGTWRLAERDPLVEWASPRLRRPAPQGSLVSLRDRNDRSYRHQGETST